MSLISGGSSSTNTSNQLSKDLLKTLQKCLEDGLTIMLHEFLYLICNSEDRLKQIHENHKAVFSKEKETIHQWELQSRGEIVSHIHRLDKEAFINKAPHHLVTKSL